jgi:hypothetical protein
MSKRYVPVVCVDCQIDAGGEGKPFALLTLRVVDGPDAGRTLYKRAYLSEKALEVSIKHLRALGWTGTKISKAMAEGLGSLKADAQLVMREYPEGSGKMKEEVNAIYPPKTFKTGNPVDTDNLAAFDALFADAAASIENTPATEANKAPAVLPAAVKGKPAPVITSEPEPF